MQQLTNITTIFNKKMFRIPDYQRGYAWQTPQLTDFWQDINTLENNKNHYMGVLSLELVASVKWKTWEEDNWLVDSKGYTPYFVVDGQQRLSTCVILIQAILEVARDLPENKLTNKEDFELCDTKISDIRKEYILQKKTNSILTSYIFGYEKDNPSYEFLKTHIFMEPSSGNQNLETLYTHNLENAKKFFTDNLLSFPEGERKTKIENIYKRITKHLLFNEYLIQDDIDVCVAFETMNNRGKKLSDLELLKNRLIYLSTLYKEEDNEKSELRKRVNDTWKEIYYQLGRNKTNPLNDDDFLRAHWIMYFKYSRKTGDDYIQFLLKEQFSPRKVLELVPIVNSIQDAKETREFEENETNGNSEDDESSSEPKYQSRLTIKEVSEYSASIQSSACHWYNTFNPLVSPSLSPNERKWIDKLNRINISYFRPLVMASFVNKEIASSERVKLFKTIERFIFIAFKLSQARSNYRNSEFYNASRELAKGTRTVASVTKSLEERLVYFFNEDRTYNPVFFQEHIANKFKSGSGFYGWSGLRYFLYEYENDLFEKSKNDTPKIIWDRFVNQTDLVSIEHILPQTMDKTCWKKLFGSYGSKQINSFTNTLGNLLALSQPKNSSLQNDCYSQKRADKSSKIGYFNGSYSENRVAEMYEEWTPEFIKERGLEMLNFMETRWDISLGNEESKVKLLNLQFFKG